MLADAECVAALHLVQPCRDAVEAAEHIEGLLVPHDLHFGVALA